MREASPDATLTVPTSAMTTSSSKTSTSSSATSSGSSQVSCQDGHAIDTDEGPDDEVQLPSPAAAAAAVQVHPRPASSPPPGAEPRNAAVVSGSFWLGVFRLTSTTNRRGDRVGWQAACTLAAHRDPHRPPCRRTRNFFQT
eukprot:8020915-Lingulodinium_polyedra.AAC.1